CGVVVLGLATLLIFHFWPRPAASSGGVTIESKIVKHSPPMVRLASQSPRPVTTSVKQTVAVPTPAPEPPPINPPPQIATVAPAPATNLMASTAVPADPPPDTTTRPAAASAASAPAASQKALPSTPLWTIGPRQVPLQSTFSTRQNSP